MQSGTQRGSVRSRAIGAVVAVALAALVVGVCVSAAGAAAMPAGAHAYRHGVVPTFSPGTRPRPPRRRPRNANLSYGGGDLGVGVTTGPPQVYLVFWGSQWGAQSTNAQGYRRSRGDPKGDGARPAGVLQGPRHRRRDVVGRDDPVLPGRRDRRAVCPASAAHVGYPTGGALAGVWEDSVGAPAQATGNQLGGGGRRRPRPHFGNTTTAANRNAAVLHRLADRHAPRRLQHAGVLRLARFSATGTDGDERSDRPTAVAFTNMPYVPDAGASCGANFVNSGAAGTLDGVTIVGGHEYAETITDQFPAGGWTDSVGNENGDKCAWISLRPGRVARTSRWRPARSPSSRRGPTTSTAARAAARSAIRSSPTGQHGDGDEPGQRRRRPWDGASSLQIQASDSGGATLTYTATGLPAGLSINARPG